MMLLPPQLFGASLCRSCLLKSIVILVCFVTSVQCTDINDFIVTSMTVLVGQYFCDTFVSVAFQWYWQDTENSKHEMRRDISWYTVCIVYVWRQMLQWGSLCKWEKTCFCLWRVSVIPKVEHLGTEGPAWYSLKSIRQPIWPTAPDAAFSRLNISHCHHMDTQKHVPCWTYLLCWWAPSRLITPQCPFLCTGWLTIYLLYGITAAIMIFICSDCSHSQVASFGRTRYWRSWICQRFRMCSFLL